MTPHHILDNLRLVADWLRVKHPDRNFEIVIAGGAALLLLGIERTTFDVDVLSPEVLPSELVEAARVVARSRGLGPEWLSCGVARVVKQIRRNRKLPSYFLQHSKEVVIADNLRIQVLGRQALISLKLLAASPSERKHTNDLISLAPTTLELRRARDFVVEMDHSLPRLEDLEIILRQIEAAE